MNFKHKKLINNNKCILQKTKEKEVPIKGALLRMEINLQQQQYL